MEIRVLKNSEIKDALALVWEVFKEYESPDYSDEGMKTFYDSIHDENYLQKLKIYGALEDENIIGVIATRSEGNHIALFFVKGKYHNKGIGRKLFKKVCDDNESGRITVNASPYATDIYHHLMFIDTDKEQLTDGLRYTPMVYQKCVDDTKREFEKSFKEGSFYNKQTQDDKHLNLLLDLVNPKDTDTILDLGTGSGYLAFAMSARNKRSSIIGLDIVTDTLKRNIEKADKNKISNIKFFEYDGDKFPLENESVDTIITRYALHHFKHIEKSFKEMYRVLKKGGKLIISDPTPNFDDSDRFVDKYMQIKHDGHVKFYTLVEFINMLEKAGFKFTLNKGTVIRFPRKNTSECRALVDKCKQDIIASYKITSNESEMWITENVLNMVFEK